MERILRPALMLAVALVAAWYLYTHGHEFLLLWEFDLRYLPLMLLLVLSSFAVNGLIMRLLVREFSVQLSFHEWYGLTTLHNFANYLPVPQAGAVARGLYLKKVHGLTYSAFTATVLVTYVQLVATVGIFGVLTLSGMALSMLHVPWPLWALFVALSITIVTLSPGAWSLPLIRRWRSLIQGLQALRQGHVLLRVAVHQIVLIVIICTAIWLSFSSLGRPVTWTASLLLALVTMVSSIINVTPGNIGVAEGAAWITAYLIHADADEAVVAYTLLRLIGVVTVFGLAPYFIARLSVPLEGSPAGEKP